MRSTKLPDERSGRLDQDAAATVAASPPDPPATITITTNSNPATALADDLLAAIEESLTEAGLGN